MGCLTTQEIIKYHTVGLSIPKKENSSTLKSSFLVLQNILNCDISVWNDQNNNMKANKWVGLSWEADDTEWSSKTEKTKAREAGISPNIY